MKSNIADNESAKMSTSKGTIPVLNTIRECFNRLGIYQDDTIITTDTGYANEANMQYNTCLKTVLTVIF